MTDVTLILRVVRVGVAAALAVGLGGWAFERNRFGASDAEALARVESELRQRFDDSAESLRTLAARVSTARALIRDAPRDPTQTGRLFDVVAAAVPEDETGRTGITIYDAGAAPLAWAGRVSDLPKERVDGPAALFVAPGALGPRLIRLDPVVDGAGPAAARRATVVVEQSLGTVQTEPGRGDTYVLSTALVPVTVRATVGGTAVPHRPLTFTVPAPGGGALVEAEVSAADLVSARARGRQMVTAAVLVVVAATFLFCTAAFIDLRRRTRDTRAFLSATAAIVALVAAARLVLYVALLPFASPGEPTAIDLLLTTLTMAAIVWLVVDLIERRRTAVPRPPLLPATGRSVAIVAAAYFVAGVVGVWLLWNYERLLRGIVSVTTLDLLHFSLHPFGFARLAIAFALVLLHAAAIWTAAALLRSPSLRWRLPRSMATYPLLGWVAGLTFATLVHRADTTVPLAPFIVAVAAAAACAAALVRLGSRARRA